MFLPTIMFFIRGSGANMFSCNSEKVSKKEKISNTNEEALINEEGEGSGLSNSLDNENSNDEKRPSTVSSSQVKHINILIFYYNILIH